MKRDLSGLLRRVAGAQQTRFVAVGGLNTVVGYASFALFERVVFSSVRFGYLASVVASYAVAISLAFVLYRRFVFKVSGHVVRDFVAFVGVYAVAIVVNLVALPILVEGLGLPALLGQAIVLVGTTLISFFGHRDVSFRRP